MRIREDWSDGDYMEWADQERLVRQDLEEANQRLRRRKAANYREAEEEEHEQHL